VVGIAAALVGVRPQALALIPAVLTAVLIDGIRTRSIRSALARFGTTWVAFALLGFVWLVASQFTSSAPAGAYGVLFRAYNPLTVMKWAAWNLADLELALGVVAFGAFPLALVGMLRRRATASEGAVGAVAMALFGWTLASAVVLSASPYGLDILHERNLFYVAPLLLTCFAWWLAAGLPRPVGLTTAAAAACLVLAAALPGRLATHVGLDSLVTLPLARLSALVPSLPITRVLVALAALGVIALLRSRRAAIPLLSVALAFAFQTATNDWTAPLSRSHQDAPAWVDNALSASAHVTLLYVDLPPNACPDRGPSLVQPKLATWTEFFNVSVDRVVSLFALNADSGLASPAATLGPDGALLRDGQPLTPRYVAADARVPLIGTPLATLKVSALELTQPAEPSGALTLWRAAQPLRLADRGALQNLRRQTRLC
jgi:hypothetical protein